MARYIYQGTHKDGNGKVVTSSNVSVFLADTDTVASVYEAEVGGGAVNSVTSDATDGSFLFWVDDGDYALTQRFKITLSKTNFRSKSYDDIDILPDPHDVKGADVASAAALDLGAGNYFDVTGTTTITSILTKGIGTAVRLHFDGALILTHHSTNLVLTGATNITTVAGDEAVFVEYATGDWRCVNYQRASSLPVLTDTDQDIDDIKNFIGERVSISSVAPQLNMVETDVSLDNKVWQHQVIGEQYRFRIINDALTTSKDIFIIDRTGQTVDLMDVQSTNLQHNGVKVPTISSIDSLSNKTLVTPTIGDATNIVNATTSVTGVSELGTIAEVKTGTDPARVPSISTIVGHEGVVKGWITFNGLGTIAILGSYNVSSIVDNSVGTYTVNWATDFADTNYSVAGMSEVASGASQSSVVLPFGGTYTVGATQIATRNAADADADSPRVNLIAIGDQ